MKLHDGIRRHFENIGFAWQESAPIVSTNPKLLFNISGGVIFEDAISHEAVLEKKRVASVQTCLRTDGWEKIGVSGRHHIVFDMLGHFSLYEMCAQEAKRMMIESAWQYLTDCLGIGPKSLSATAHPNDEVSQKIWNNLGVAVRLDSKNVTHTPSRNRCGVRTEIVWENPHTSKSVELWNLVFTEFQGETVFESPLSKIAADSGASIDRIVTAIECCDNDYENSGWKDVVSLIAERSTVRDRTRVFRLVDLGKASVLLASQGLRPGNKAAEYVLRKIIREAYILCQQSSLPFEEFAAVSSSYWAGKEAALGLITEEALKFEKGLERGRKEYVKLISRRSGPLTTQDAEYLSSTFGYPRALIEFEESKRDKEAQ